MTPLDAVAVASSTLDSPQVMTNYGGGRQVAEDIDGLIKRVRSQGWRVERDSRVIGAFMRLTGRTLCATLRPRATRGGGSWT